MDLILIARISCERGAILTASGSRRCRSRTVTRADDTQQKIRRGVRPDFLRSFSG